MGLLWSLPWSIKFLFLYSLLSSSITNCLHASIQPTHECHKDESYALLQFKKSFVISKYASHNRFSYPKTVSWIPGTDCCSWDGINCDKVTGHVIGLDLSSSQLYGSMDVNSSLFSLVHLQSLDLSDNDFNHSQIPAKIGGLSQLRYLNLSQFSEITFSGEIPPEISHFPKLLSIDLRSYVGYQLQPPEVPFNHLRLNISILRSLIQNSTRLVELRLNFVTISSSVPDILTNLTYLQKLSLSYCELYGEFPIGIFHLPNLRVLSFGYNQKLRGMLPDFHSRALISVLYLSGTSFYGKLPASIGNLSSLNCFFIANCNFYGSIPISFGNLNQLTYLDMAYNNLQGEIPHSLFRLVNLAILSLGFNSLQGQLELDKFLELKMLTSLMLSNNKLSLLTGKSSPNVTLPPIQVLELDSCNLSGEIPSWITNLTTLSYLSLQRNNLQGKIPYSLFRLENLASLTLDSNLFEGELEIDMFLKLKMLFFLGLSYNKLSLLTEKVSSNITLPPLEVLALGSCNLVEFPSFLQDLDELGFLEMQDNDFKSIPNWIWRKRSLQDLYLSDNSLTGELSPMICNLKSLVVLDFSHNNFSGRIPSCLGTFSQSLQVLVLHGNKLFGHIPQLYMIGSDLRMIDFSNNNLEGQLPRALVNCRMLEFLDVSHNHINDIFPSWLGTLPELKVIALSYNEFYGVIMCRNRCTFPKLHIIDLSHNKFFGNLSSEIIKNWKSMTISNTSQLRYEDIHIYLSRKSWSRNWNVHHYYSFSMTNKGVIMNYEELQHFYELVAIDLSGNKISGEIPDVIGDLRNLVLLNLSNNMLSGNIPSSLGKLSNLEVLDLSLNSLSGMIPQQLTELTFLEFFNVSLNNLSGLIPENKQFSTFQSNSFEGNQGLCGIQLLKTCEDHSRPPVLACNRDQDSDLGSFFEFSRKIIMIGYGCGLVVGLALGDAFGSNINRWLKRIF